MYLVSLKRDFVQPERFPLPSVRCHSQANSHQVPLCETSQGWISRHLVGGGVWGSRWSSHWRNAWKPQSSQLVKHTQGSRQSLKHCFACVILTCYCWACANHDSEQYLSCDMIDGGCRTGSKKNMRPRWSACMANTPVHVSAFGVVETLDHMDRIRVQNVCP